jgi:Uma2 family endonuclease
MGQPAEKLRRATYADVEAAPANKVAELIRGTLHVMPRPAPKHARAEGALQGELFGPFDRGRGGPGGWWILPEPELHFPDPTAEGEIDVAVPDVAGWRRERMPDLPDEAYFTLAPDWICEVLSPTSTEKRDREEKMPLYAREGARHAWLIDPIKRTLEVFVLGGRRWMATGTYRDSDRVRVEPFDAIELDLSALWAK